MRVSGLATDGDWRFGRGRASYLRNSDAIRQNVVTRLRSFRNDWFLDIDHGVAWLDLLGRRNASEQIRRAVERTILDTPGVRAITSGPSVSVDSERAAIVSVSLIDIFDTRIDIEGLGL